MRHARWGEGLVVGIEREGADVIVTVGFASVGRKRLSLQYAHLEEIVSRDDSAARTSSTWRGWPGWP